MLDLTKEQIEAVLKLYEENEELFNSVFCVGVNRHLTPKVARILEGEFASFRECGKYFHAELTAHPGYFCLLDRTELTPNEKNTVIEQLFGGK